VAHGRLLVTGALLGGRLIESYGIRARDLTRRAGSRADRSDRAGVSQL
jgi:hypothetical protein